MIPSHLKELIKKYREGYNPNRQEGKWVKANSIPDYETFAEYWLKRKREGTVKVYLNYLHLWVIPINEQNIVDWDTSIELIDEKRHEYKMQQITYKTKSGANLKYKNWSPKYLQKSSDYRTNSLARLEYNLYRALVLYFQSIGNTRLSELMPNVKELGKPRHFVKMGHLTIEEFEKLRAVLASDRQIYVLTTLLFYTGARISELLMAKKNRDWIPSYVKGKDIKLQKGELFEIRIPLSFAKSHEAQNLYLNNRAHIQLAIDYINEIKDNNYLFKLHKDLNTTKTYLDIDKEKNVLREVLENGLKSAGLSHKVPEITIHSLRRSYIHYIYNEFNMDLEFTSNAARHTSGVGMTAKYLKTKAEEVKERLKKHYTE